MRAIFLTLTFLALAACTPDREDPPAAASPAAVSLAENWRLEISLPHEVLPVQLHLATDFSEAWLENGAERAPIPEIHRDGNRLQLRIPAFNNTLDLELSGDRLAGELTLVKRGYEQNMPVRGMRGLAYRFSPNPVAAVDVTGRWEVVFTEDNGNKIPAVAELDQRESRVLGTFLTPTGDYRYLEGEVNDRQLKLSTFDGAHAYVFTATMDSNGALAGDMWSGTRSHENWVAHKNFDAKLPDPYSLTFLKEGYDSLEFSFPDLDGQIVSLADDRYQGKVVLVTLSGTWCPNCADEVGLLTQYYRRNHDRGVEIITLLYEHFDDFERAAAQGKALRNQYGIDYELLVAGVSDKVLAAETLPMLKSVVAFPTMIFIDRAGRVRRIHTGFSGPGTGAYYTAFLADFERFMDELLAEKST
jgi:peroxiredoxin